MVKNDNAAALTWDTGETSVQSPCLLRPHQAQQLWALFHHVGALFFFWSIHIPAVLDQLPTPTHSSQLHLPLGRPAPTWDTQASQQQRHTDGKRQVQEHDQQKPVQHAPSDLSSTSTASPGYPDTPKSRAVTFKLHLMKMIVAFKKNIKNFFKEIQENTEVEALKEATDKFLK